MDLTRKILIVACVALSLAIAVLIIAIVGIYYALNPSKNLGNIETGFITASGPITSSNSITTSGAVTSNGINFANPSGSVALLNFNTGPYLYSSPLAGAYDSTSNWTAKLFRLGDIVTMQWAANLQSLAVDAVLAATITIPSEFYPAETLYIPIIVANAGTATNGLMIIIPTGSITIYASAAQATFSGVGSCGILSGSTSWSFV